MSAYVRVVRSIWTDPEWLDLTSIEKLVYLQLISQPNISKCGVLPFVPRRWAHMHPDLSAEDLVATLSALEVKRYIVVDRDTEELLVRTYLRYDEAWKQTNGTRGIQIEAQEIMSKRLLGVVIQEYEQASSNSWHKGSDKGNDNPCDEGSDNTRATPLTPNPEPKTLNLDPEPTLALVPTEDSGGPVEAEIVPDWEVQFNEWWGMYPRKRDKKKAQTAFKNLTKTNRALALNALPDHVQQWQRDSTEIEFIPHPTTWLNGKRWEDELESDYRPAMSLRDQAIYAALQDRHAQEQNDETTGSNQISRESDWDDEWVG
jgi:hypothetical protein